MFELTASKIADHSVLTIPPGTALPEHIEDSMVYVGTSADYGHYVQVYLCEDAVIRGMPVVFTVCDRADFRACYRHARMMRPGGAANRR
ncbi:hypothetical protein KL86APRO_12551 [uncultured Alphaproteobacteria bacterium]|uniref:Uncharacterized protein n=1 Tax=uncultured Alphaproteobacteria bacterium TaxID=91750 RepID=A0A212KC09_9PROT|nr:hypothetical protein KL86APRO_12551 [uncultured Alphaproteobacteria bacterium]